MSPPVLGWTETVLAVVALCCRWPLLAFRSWRPVMLMDDLGHPPLSSGVSCRHFTVRADVLPDCIQHFGLPLGQSAAFGCRSHIE